MSTHTHAIFNGNGNRVIHHRRISGMPGTGDIGGGDVLNDRFIHAQFIGTKALSHVAVKINSFHCRVSFQTQALRS